MVRRGYSPSWDNLLALIFVAVIVTSGAAQDVVGCGGFVRPPATWEGDSTNKLDYSRFSVMLFTTQGLLKASTECAPNGYYFLPIYDRGQFILRISGPEGWSTEPTEFPVTIDDKTMQCHHGRDVDFVISGFRVKTRVLGLETEQCDVEGSEDGPGGVTVTLLHGEKAAYEAVTVEGGLCTFLNVMPGAYRMVGSHPLWRMARSEVRIEVGWGNVEVEEHLVVAGYDLRGSVRASGDPIFGVQVFLYGSTDDGHTECPQITGDVPERAGRPPLCMVRSDTQGRFLFNGVTCGTYTLVPFYKGTNTVFEVTPAEVTVKMGHGSYTLPDPFEVTGFSVGGRVVDMKGAGVGGVTILVDAQEKTVTDDDGYYTLDSLSAGSYTIEAEKDHVFFHGMKDCRISPNMLELPLITVSRYHLCGSVIIPQPPGTTMRAHYREVVLRKEGESTDVKRVTDPSGTYCFEVEPGSYRVTPVLMENEMASGLMLSPSHRDVVISTGAVLNADFAQALVTVSGYVRCILTLCDPAIVVVLSSAGKTVTTQPREDAQEGGFFMFQEVLPGNYRVSVRHNSWCWNKKEIPLVVTTEDISNVDFTQTGFNLTVESTHEVSLTSTTEDGDTFDMQVQKGLNHFCLPKPGIHELHVSSCYQFDDTMLHYDTRVPHVLRLVPTHYLVTGRVDTPAETLHDVSLVIRRHGTSEDGTTVVAHESTVKDGIRTLTYEYWAVFGEELDVVPMCTTLLFYPPSTTVSVKTTECPVLVSALEGRTGLYLRGAVIPPVSDVQILVLAASTGKPAGHVETDRDGAYIVGPLYDDESYRVVAHKDNYLFEEIPEEAGILRAVRLANVVVMVEDEQGKSVSGVLLSLSSTGYRSNNMTDVKGSFDFQSLSPGQFFLRPFLKEYTFTPSSLTIDVEEGQSYTRVIKGTRVAYSAFGFVHSLQGDPEGSVMVQATNKEGAMEETLTDKLGYFRLRGLHPDTEYSICVKRGVDNDRLERASPGSTTVRVTREDVKDLEFVVFPRSQRFAISGVVETDPEVLPTIQVELFTSSNDVNPHKRLLLPFSKYFEFPSLAPGSYRVHLYSSLSEDMYTFHRDDAHVTLRDEDVHLVMMFTTTSKPKHHDVGGAPAGVALFVIIVALCFNYRKKLLGLIALLPRPSAPPGDTSSGKSGHKRTKAKRG